MAGIAPQVDQLLRSSCSEGDVLLITQSSPFIYAQTYSVCLLIENACVDDGVWLFQAQMPLALLILRLRSGTGLCE